MCTTEQSLGYMQPFCDVLFIKINLRQSFSNVTLFTGCCYSVISILLWHGVQIVSNVWFKFQYSFCVFISVPRPDFFYGILMCKICGVHGSYSVVEPSQLLATHTTAMHTLGRWLSFARDAGSCDDVRPRWLTLSQPCHHFPPITGRQTTHVSACGRSN